METTEEGRNQAIIPGLPDDLALRCLAKISHGFHGLLQSVSKQWRNSIRSMEYANIKASGGWCGNWLFVSTYMEGKSQWDAYDPDADRWHHLPRFPRDDFETHFRFSCVSVCKRFLVIGGCYVSCPIQRHEATNDVMMFDPFKQLWSRASNMRTPRLDFACAVVGNKVYVAGGSNSSCIEGLAVAEVYDPVTDRWEDLPPMPFPLMDCFGLSHGGRFHVISQKRSNIHENTYVVFDPLDQKWQIAEDMSPFSELSRYYTAVVNGRIYTILEDGTIRVANTDGIDWYTVGTFPPVLLPNHLRPLKPFNFNFIGFKQYLYVAGGMTLKYDSNSHAYAIVELNTTKFCDPTKLPLEWRNVRPMPRPSGGIAGCAALEE